MTVCVFEGLDGTGKSTLISKFLEENKNFSLYTPEKPQFHDIKKYPEIVRGEYLSFSKTIKHIKSNLLIDRFFPSEIVYSQADSRSYNINYLWDLDCKLADFGVKLIYCKAEFNDIINRVKDRKDNPEKYIERLKVYKDLYEDFLSKTNLSTLVIDTSKDSIEECLYTIRRALIVRKDWQSYFMDLAFTVRERSTCARRQVGAVLVKEKNIISTGYNGSPTGMENCMYMDNCIRAKKGINSGELPDYTFASHAEANAIAQAAKSGVSTAGAEIFITNFPCSTCLKLIKQAGVSKVYFRDDYDDNFSKIIAKEMKIEIVRIP